jgi:hypothetical protein
MLDTEQNNQSQPHEQQAECDQIINTQSRMPMIVFRCYETHCWTSLI